MMHQSEFLLSGMLYNVHEIVNCDHECMIRSAITSECLLTYTWRNDLRLTGECLLTNTWRNDLQLFLWQFFLDASSHLYNRLCLLVGRSVGWLVGWLVGNAFIFSTEKWFYPSKRSIHQVIHSINHSFIHK